MKRAEKRFSPARGFTLVELTLVLVAFGVLGLFATFAFSGVDDVRRMGQARAETEVARGALRAFLLSNKRLPCPDTDANGYEDGGPGGCSTPGETGWLPYLTLGLNEAAHNRMFYGVYRGAAPNDITSLQERTGDAEGAPTYLNLGDAIMALGSMSDALDIAHIHTAGIFPNGAPDCAAGHNAAFVLIVPQDDRDGAGGFLDGANVAGDLCFASPLSPHMQNYDDVVVEESPSVLIGWLMRHMS
jgi:prepilin-type N-terminal cleavage/methylation domain-containing protein